MKLRTFTAPTITEAMAQIRATLGDDAVIVGTDAVADGMRVTAACDTPAAKMPAPGPADTSDRLYETLAFHRVPADLSDRLVTAALGVDTDDMALALGGALDAVLGFRPLDIAGTSGRILLVGPTGHGKTLTAARLAAREVLAGRAVRVCAADGRAGAVAQITELCHAMKVIPVPVATICGDTAPVIIDSPGVNPLDTDELLAVRDLAHRTGAEPVLVLSAGCDPDESGEIAEAFAAVGVRRLIATHCDSARRLGGIIAAAGRGLALAEAGIGRTLAQTLVAMHPVALSRLLLSVGGDAQVAKERAA